MVTCMLACSLLPPNHLSTQPTDSRTTPTENHTEPHPPCTCRKCPIPARSHKSCPRHTGLGTRTARRRWCSGGRQRLGLGLGRWRWGHYRYPHRPPTGLQPPAQGMAAQRERSVGSGAILRERGSVMLAAGGQPGKCVSWRQTRRRMGTWPGLHSSSAPGSTHVFPTAQPSARLQQQTLPLEGGAGGTQPSPVQPRWGGLPYLAAGGAIHWHTVGDHLAIVQNREQAGGASDGNPADVGGCGK